MSSILNLCVLADCSVEDEATRVETAGTKHKTDRDGRRFGEKSVPKESNISYQSS